MIDRLHCPQCRGPVYAPCGSHGERIDCLGCGAELVTRLALDETVTVELVDPPTAESRQARALAAIDKERSVSTKQFLAELSLLLGVHAPARRVEHHQIGAMDVFAWPDDAEPSGDWWWALACDGGVFAIGRAPRAKIATAVSNPRTADAVETEAFS